MKKIFGILALLAYGAWGACADISMPTDFSTVASGTRANLKANFDETQTKGNACFDSTDEVRARLTGYTGSFTIASLDHLRLRLDTDNSLTGKLLVFDGASSDTLFSVGDDKASRFYTTLRVDSLTASSLVATDANKVLTSTISSLSPTFTGLTLSGATASRVAVFNGSKALASNASLTANGFLYPDGTGSLASTAAATNGQLLIGSTSAAPVAASLTGTSDEVTVTPGAGSITLDIPNSFTLPSASPTFTGLNLSGLTASSLVATDASKNLTSTVSGLSPTMTGLNLSGLTASQAVFTDGSKNLVSNAITGTGNVAMSSGPTFTGTIIAQALTASNVITGNSSGAGSSSAIQAVAASPVWRTSVTGAAVDTKEWETVGGGTTLISRTRTDAFGAGNNWLQVTRSGTGITDISFGEATNNPTHTFLGTGEATFNGDLNVVRSSSGGIVNFNVENSNSASGSAANIRLAVNGTSAGAADPYIHFFNSGIREYALGMDVSAAGQPFVLSHSATVGSSNLMSITSSGQATFSDSVIGTSARFTGTVSTGTEAFEYDEDSFTATLTGCTAGTTGTAYYTVIGKNVTLYLPLLQCTSNTTACTITGLPAAVWPTRTQFVPAYEIGDNSVIYRGHLEVTSSGVIELWFYTTATAAPSNTFTNSNTKGLTSSITFPYNLQ